MILKLFGLPRTCTNLTKYMVERYTVEDVTVWHHRPGVEDCIFHKHGGPRVTPGADGYLLCWKPRDLWVESIRRRTPWLDKSLALEVWGADVAVQFSFQVYHPSLKCFVVSSQAWLDDPKGTMRLLCKTFGLTLRGNCALPTNALNRGGDALPTVETDVVWTEKK